MVLSHIQFVIRCAQQLVPCRFLRREHVDCNTHLGNYRFNLTISSGWFLLWWNKLYWLTGTLMAKITCTRVAVKLKSTCITSYGNMFSRPHGACSRSPEWFIQVKSKIQIRIGRDDRMFRKPHITGNGNIKYRYRFSYPSIYLYLFI